MAQTRRTLNITSQQNIASNKRTYIGRTCRICGAKYIIGRIGLAERVDGDELVVGIHAREEGAVEDERPQNAPSHKEAQNDKAELQKWHKGGGEAGVG
jgi:hypothetical protein